MPRIAAVGSAIEFAADCRRRAAIREPRLFPEQTERRACHKTMLKCSYGHTKSEADARINKTCAVRARCSAAARGVIVGANVLGAIFLRALRPDVRRGVA